jgi:hypothetical protein
MSFGRSSPAVVSARILKRKHRDALFENGFPRPRGEFRLCQAKDKGPRPSDAAFILEFRHHHVSTKNSPDLRLRQEAIKPGENQGGR